MQRFGPCNRHALLDIAHGDNARRGAGLLIAKGMYAIDAPQANQSNA
jgi:hypothetical protein